MNRSIMLKKLEKGEDPLTLSIKKWKDIVSGKGKDRADENCALCEVYRREKIRGPYLSWDIQCKGCPVMNLTGKQFCQGTPWRSNPKAELNFLITLADRNSGNDEK